MAMLISLFDALNGLISVSLSSLAVFSLLHEHYSCIAFFYLYAYVSIIVPTQNSCFSSRRFRKISFSCEFWSVRVPVPGACIVFSWLLLSWVDFGSLPADRAIASKADVTLGKRHPSFRLTAGLLL